MEQYKKLNGNNKRPASTEPYLDESSQNKKPHIDQPSNGSTTSANNSNGVSIGATSTNSISVPAGSSISTTAGGQKVITTPGKFLENQLHEKKNVYLFFFFNFWKINFTKKSTSRKKMFIYLFF